VAFSLDERLLVTGSPDAVAMWDVETGQQLWKFGIPQPTCPKCQGYADVLDVAFSTDGEYIATASMNHLTDLWCARTGKHISTLKGHQDEVRCVEFSPDGSMVVTGSKDKTCRLWDAATGHEKARFPGSRPVAFSTCGNTILAAAAGGAKTSWQACLWDWAGQRELRLFEMPGSGPMAFTRDQRIAVVDIDEKAIGFWEMNSGKELDRLDIQGRLVYEVVLWPDDGRFAAIASEAGLQLWDRKTSCGVHLDVDCTRPDVAAAAISATGRYLVAGNDDGWIWLWECGLNAAVRSG
jgi:WD40 repeat protein